jgi:LEA14-like dessication related protein
MKFLKSIFVILFLAIIMFLLACSSIEDPKFISIDKIELLEERSDELIVTSDISIFNPNWFEISAEDVSFNLYIDTFYIGNGNIEKIMVLPKKDTSIISSTLNIQKKLLASFSDLKDSVSLHILGSTAIPYVSRRYYFDFDYKIYIHDFITLFADKVMQDVDVKISEISISKIDIQNIYLDVVFMLYNKSEMACKIKKLDVKVYKTSNYKDVVGNSKIKDSFTIQADSFNEFKSQVKVNTLSMASAIFSNNMSNKNTLFIKANSIVEYNNIDIPITIKRSVDYNPLTLEIELK